MSIRQWTGPGFVLGGKQGIACADPGMATMTREQLIRRFASPEPAGFPAPAPDASLDSNRIYAARAQAVAVGDDKKPHAAIPTDNVFSEGGIAAIYAARK